MSASTEPAWSVKHYQVNGAVDGQGEGAIYLLIDSNSKSTVRKKPGNTKPEIMFALLLDSGYSALFLQNLINLMTQVIPLEYCCGDYDLVVGKTMKFDAVLITHWDQVGARSLSSSRQL